MEKIKPTWTEGKMIKKQAFILCLIVSLMGISLCLLGSLLATRTNAEFSRYQAINLPVDFSKIAEYKTEFRWKYNSVHGKEFRLRVMPAFNSEQAMRDSLNGLKAHLKIELKDSGRIVFESEISEDSFTLAPHSGCELTATRSVYEPYIFFSNLQLEREWLNRCNLSLLIESPATGLADREQVIVCHNVICATVNGMSRVFGSILIVLGISTLLIGATIFWRNF